MTKRVLKHTPRRAARALSRRELLARSGSGLGSLALAHLLTGSGLLPSASAAGRSGLAAREPHHAPRARSVIWLFMEGGPSHIDLFDPKPELERLAGQLTPPSFKLPVTSGHRLPPDADRPRR